jgi:peptide chain release factor 2
MVKDLRTGQETNQTGQVLDGFIDAFLDAGIRWRKQNEAAA